MQVFVVGGAVRDALLGRSQADRDYVVVGASPEQMLAAGYLPVGRDFPVFLHPQTREEYALARTERKSGHGYHGFTFHAAPDVTLEEDLVRRDLTINAMARAEDGTIFDPYQGQQDLRDKVLRHVGPAFVEDPVRILRLARFAARFADFSIAPETAALMGQMVAEGEVDHLVPERVWQEVAKGLMEDRPSRMFTVLHDCGALARLMPEVARLYGVPQRPEYHPEGDCATHTLLALDQAAKQGGPLAVRFATLTHDLGKGTTPTALLPRHHGHETRGVALGTALCQRLKVPNDCRDLALLAARYHGDIHRAAELRPETVLKLLERADALRRPERFAQLLAVCQADFTGRLGWEDRPYDAPAILNKALDAVRALDAGAIARQCSTPGDIPQRLHAARLGAIKHALRGNSQETCQQPQGE